MKRDIRKLKSFKTGAANFRAEAEEAKKDGSTKRGAILRCTESHYQALSKSPDMKTCFVIYREALKIVEELYGEEDLPLKDIWED